jgi:tripartite-type tricarboxylate transporter receptor subunit TctC
VRRSLPVTSVQEFIDLVRREPGKYTYGSGGHGSISHFAGELLKTQAGINLLQVPYAGAGPALRDVIAGHVDATFTGAGVTVADQVKVLATTGAKRTDIMPNVPTLIESGLPNYELASWFGFLAPAGTARSAVNKFAADIKRVIESGDLKKRLRDTGSEVEIVSYGPDEFRDFIRKETPVWQELVKATKIPVEN